MSAALAARDVFAATKRSPDRRFAVTAKTPQFTREQLLSAERAGDAEWRVKGGDRLIRFAPFWAFTYERYSIYPSVTA